MKLEFYEINKEISTFSPISHHEKFINKCKENPFVPLGIILTCSFFANGLRYFVKKDSVKQNKMMKGRVTAQILTFAVIVIGHSIQKWKLDKEAEKEALKNFVE